MFERTTIIFQLFLNYVGTYTDGYRSLIISAQDIRKLRFLSGKDKKKNCRVSKISSDIYANKNPEMFVVRSTVVILASSYDLVIRGKNILVEIEQPTEMRIETIA